MVESLNEFRKQMLAAIEGWHEQLSEVQKSLRESLHPYQQAALGRIADVLGDFISEGEVVLAGIAPLK